MSELDPHGAILRAARWAEQRRLPTPAALYDIAARVAAGELDVSDMPAMATPWSSMLIYLEAKGIDVAPDALELARALADQADHDHEAILLALRPMVEAWRAT